MSNRGLYLIFRESIETTRLIPFVFTEPLTHREVANFVLKAHPEYVLLSGGCFTVDLDMPEVLCYNSASSIPSLKMTAHDAETLKIAFCDWSTGGGF